MPEIKMLETGGFEHGDVEEPRCSAWVSSIVIHENAECVKPM